MSTTTSPQECLELVAVGAHMSGLPLNHQLVSLGGTLVRQCRTAPVYKMFSLGVRPALVRLPKQEAESSGRAYEVEVWSLPIDNVGKFLRDGVKPPLCIGDVALEDNKEVKGFLGESYLIQDWPDVQDISQHAGWRAFLASRSS